MITDKQIINFLTNMNKFGGELTVAPGDWLNPGLGYTATLKLPSGNSKGYWEVRGSSETGIGAVADLIRHPDSSVIPID